MCEEKSVRSSPANTKVSEDEGGPGTGAEIPWKAAGQAVVRQVFPHSPWRSVPEQIATLQPVEDTGP